MAIWEINPMEGPRQVPAGIFSRNVSRTIFTHLERVKHSHEQVRTALLRTPGTHCRWCAGSKFAPLVRTLLREARANLVGGYQRGYHEKLPEQAFSKRQVSNLVSTKSRLLTARTGASQHTLFMGFRWWRLP